MSKILTYFVTAKKLSINTYYHIMNKNICFYPLLLAFAAFMTFTTQDVYAQQRVQTMRGRVTDLYGKKPLENAHVINMTTLRGGTTDANGFFHVSAAVGDSLYISYVGHESISAVVSLNMLQREYTTFYLKTEEYQLQEVNIQAHNLSGILNVDLKVLDPGFETRVVELYRVKKSEDISTKAANASPLNPVEFIAGFFSGDKKLEKMKQQNEVANMLADRYDRDFLKKMLNLSQEEIDQLLIYCREDPKKALKASDLDLINSLLKCKEDLEKKAKQVEKEAEEEEDFY